MHSGWPSTLFRVMLACGKGEQRGGGGCSRRRRIIPAPAPLHLELWHTNRVDPPLLLGGALWWGDRLRDRADMAGCWLLNAGVVLPVLVVVGNTLLGSFFCGRVLRMSPGHHHHSRAHHGLYPTKSEVVLLTKPLERGRAPCLQPWADTAAPEPPPRAATATAAQHQSRPLPEAGSTTAPCRVPRLHTRCPRRRRLSAVVVPSQRQSVYLYAGSNGGQR